MHLQLLAFSFGAFIFNSLPPIPVDSRVDCLSRCYHQTNCSSFFYLDGSCFLTENVFAVAEQDVQSSAVQYFVLVSEKCKPGYIWYRSIGLCYRLSARSSVWQDAEDLCQSEGGHLITVDSLKLLDFIIHLMISLDRSFWIGGKTIDGTDWLWADDSTLDTDFWDSNEPDGGADQCIFVNKHTQKWRDANCTGIKRFVCAMSKPGLYLC